MSAFYRDDFVDPCLFGRLMNETYPGDVLSFYVWSWRGKKRDTHKVTFEGIVIEKSPFITVPIASAIGYVVVRRDDGKAKIKSAAKKKK